MNEVIDHNNEVGTMRQCTINDFCRLCASLDENMVPIYADEGADHMLENKIKTHLPFLNISKNDLLPKRICYHCASAVLVWNELYETSSEADQKLRRMFETSQYDRSECKNAPYEDIEGIHVPVKDFIGEESIEYEEIADVNIFNKNDKSDKTLNELDKIPSTSKTQNILNHDPKPSVIQEDERLNPSSKSEISDLFRRTGEDNGDSEDHNIYLNTADIDDDINGSMNCHRLEDILATDHETTSTLLVPKQEYVMPESNEDDGDEEVTSDDHNMLQHHQNGITLPVGITAVGPMDEREFKPSLQMMMLKSSDHVNGDDESGGANGSGGDDDEELIDTSSMQLMRQFYAQQAALSSLDGTASDDEDCSQSEHQDNTCQICATVFKNRYNLLRHFQKRHPEFKMYECDLCRISFPSIDEFKDHLEDKHSRVHTTQTANSKQVRFMCNVCGNMYKNKASAMNHLLTHTAKKTVNCTLCDFTCYTKQQLGVHMTKHDKRFACTICHKRFAQKSQLDVHINAVHYNHRPYACQLCKKSFKTKGSHDAHMIVHTDTRNYQCPHCDKKCRKRYDLTLHIRTHTGEKPFKCSVCGRGFVQMCDTRKHEMLHFKPGKRKTAFVSSDPVGVADDE